MCKIAGMGLFGRPKQKDVAVEQLNALFDKFEYTDIEKLCKDVIGKVPPSSKERSERIHLLEFIWEQYRNQGLNLQQVKDFAIKEGIVTPDFFD